MPIRKRFSDYKQKHNTANKRNKRETETDQLREVRLENLRTHATTLTTTRKIMKAEGPKKLSAGTSRKSRPEGGVTASILHIKNSMIVCLFVQS